MLLDQRHQFYIHRFHHLLLVKKTNYSAAIYS